MKYLRLPLLVLFGFIVLVLGLFTACQRDLLYYPTHQEQSAASMSAGLRPWYADGVYTGYVRLVDHPRRVWLFTHGNGGQAANRHWALHCFNPGDAIYILEYPGYGERPGSPSREAFNAAALAAFRWLQRTYPPEQLIVLGESLGSGPASYLTTVPDPARRLVLVVPFDRIVDVAGEKYPFLPVRLLMRDQWDNLTALSHFTGRIDIFGAKFDQVIPVAHARKLAAHVPGAVYHEFPGDHGWTSGDLVDLSQIE